MNEQTQKDIEAVKRAADAQKRPLSSNQSIANAAGTEAVESQCNCIGKPRWSPDCPVHNPQPGRKVEGDIVTRSSEPVDENLEAAKEFVSGSSPMWSTPHPYKGMPGLIGGSCQVCGLSAPEAVHHTKSEQEPWQIGPGQILPMEDTQYDAVIPPHYQRGPKVTVSHNCSEAEVGEQEYTIQAIDVMRAMQDPRLATAFKYIWRVAFGGKHEPWDSRTPEEVDTRDIKSAIWYLEDFLEHRNP